MPKGFFSQAVCLVTDGRTTIADVRTALEAAGVEVAREVPAQKLWSFGGPALVIPFRPQVNGSVTIDVVDKVWPDSMGDPKSDPMTFGAWSMGYFGPFAYPGGLERAIQHCWGWQAGRAVAPNHRGFIRVRSSYVGGADSEAPVLPSDYDPISEMLFLSRLVLALEKVPGVLCYFNPNGEVLQDLAQFRRIFDACENEKKLPLLLWMNVRFFRINDALTLMDTVGNSQLDIRDIEVICSSADYTPDTIDYYMRNVSHYLLDLGREIKTGEAIDGPGETNLSWTAEACENALLVPPRSTLRLCPKANAAHIRSALAAAGRGE